MTTSPSLPSDPNAPITPFWSQPSHPQIQEVRYGSTDPADGSFMTKSFSRVALPPYAVFARLDFPPCTMATVKTYATVQCGRGKDGKGEHLNLNSDLLFINHGCEPSLILDIPQRAFLVGPKGLQPGDELTFFYPSTEWDMAQSFECICGAPSCKGTISGAGNMTSSQLRGVWLNGFIRELLEERDAKRSAKTNGAHGEVNGKQNGYVNGVNGEIVDDAAPNGRAGPTSRELSGEMGGDTIV